MELYWDNTAGGTYQGVIEQISHMSEDQKSEADKKIYKAYVSFVPDERIRLGMTMILYPVAPAEQETEEPTAEEEPETEHEIPAAEKTEEESTK